MKYTYLLLAASIGLLAGCSQIEQDIADVNSLSDGDLVERVIFEVLPVKDGDDPETKASAVPNGGSVGFVWEATDTVGIYPDKGSQVYFNIEDGVGTSSVSFTGGGWALKQNSTYASYYPFVGDIYLKRGKIPVSFAGQKQIGTSSPFHGARYYLATEPTSSKNGVLQFSYNTLNTIINVNATLPAGTYTKASLTIEEPLFIEEGTYSLDDRVIVGTKFTNTLEIDLEDVVLTEETTIPVYFMSAPVDLKGKDVVVRFLTADGLSYMWIKQPSKAYLAGTRYGLTCDTMVSENNIIYYTTTDGNIITPYSLNGFQGKLVLNEYIDGRGVLTFSQEVVTVAPHAFHDCTTLTSMTLPDSVTDLGYSTFNGCSNLTSINIPEGVTTIKSWAFGYCSSLRDVVLPEQVMSIEYCAFAHCTELTHVNLPKGITIIGQYAFEDCLKLTDVVLPERLTILEYGAFYGCSSFVNVILPDSLTSIGEVAFAGCSSLTSITVLLKTPPIGNVNMFNRTNNAPIYVPAESVDAYKSAQHWNDYADRIQAIPDSPSAVDLGLSVMWASFNIGATKPEEYGDYYAWGELEPRTTFSYDYKWLQSGSWGSTEIQFSKYNDYPSTLKKEDDIANYKWGDPWRMPTFQEQTELRTQCDWSYTEVNGITGWKIQSRTNNNSIFLPDAGNDNGLIINGAARGQYWSSTLYYSNASAYCLDCIPPEAGDGDRPVYYSSPMRCSGLSVRAVRD